MPSRARPASAWRMTERVTSNSAERSRSAGRRSPGWSSPPAMRAASAARTFLCSGSYMVWTIWYDTGWHVVWTIIGSRWGRHDDARARAAGELVERAGAPGLRAPSRRSCARSGYCARPVRLRGTDRDLRRARAAARVVDGHRARRHAAQGVRQPPRGRLPAVRRALPPGRLPPDRRRPARRQGRPRHGRRAPGGVRHADRAELRARAHARARTGRAAAALPAAPRRPGLPARRAALLRRACTTRTIRASASRCAASASTTRARWCGTTCSASCGAARRSTCRARSRGCAGITQKQLRKLVRVAYVKVAEYQRRGLVHLHVVDPARSRDARLPRRRAPAARARASPSSCSSTRSAPPSPTCARRSRTSSAAARVRWGERARRPPARPGERARRGRRLPGQVRDQEHRAGRRRPAPRRPSTQVDAAPGARARARLPARRVRRSHADPALADRRFAACAHALGYRGHCLTKSRRYSTTFKALRQARERHVHEQLLARSRDAAQRAIAAAARAGRELPLRRRRAISQPPTRILAASAAARSARAPATGARGARDVRSRGMKRREGGRR